MKTVKNKRWGDVKVYEKGDTVLVDRDFRGGYFAKIVEDYGVLFVRIKDGDREWDIMKNRVELYEKVE